MKTVCLVSGGADSTTLLYKLLNEGDEVLGISFGYGQKHDKEITAARDICDKASVPFTYFDISSLAEAFEGSCLTNDAIEVPTDDGTYSTKVITVVPNRNAVLLNVAIAFAISKGFDRVAYGAHATDYEIYPDCRPVFVERMQDVADVANYKIIQIYAPFLQMSKTDIVKLGLKLGVPFEMTWSCYRGGEAPCGVCATCIERIRAFEESGVKDPAL